MCHASSAVACLPAYDRRLAVTVGLARGGGPAQYSVWSCEARVACRRRTTRFAYLRRFSGYYGEQYQHATSAGSNRCPVPFAKDTVPVTRRAIPFAAMLAFALFSATAFSLPQTRAQTPAPTGALDVTIWQARDDGTESPLAEVSLLLANPTGAQVALVKTDANGSAHLEAPPGAYSLTAYRDGYAAAGKADCGGSKWDQSSNVQWGRYSAEQEVPLQITPGRGICRQYLFDAITPPPPGVDAITPPPPSHPVYLTFDDGYVDLCQTVDLVDRLGIHATFFLTGQAILAQPDCVRRLVAAGNLLGNHTFAHENLTRLSRGQIISTLQRTEDAVEAVAGVTTRPLCRPPYGAINAFVRQVPAEWGCRMILWDRDTRDWAGTSTSYIIGQALSVSCNGETILMHTQAFPREQIAVPEIVTQLSARGCDVALLPAGS